MEKKEFKIDEILNTAVTNHRKNNFSVAKKLYDQILKIDPNQIFVTTGSSGAFLLTFISCFDEGQKVDIRGVAKGKGFAGVVKRHNFKTQDMSHGNSVVPSVLAPPGVPFKGDIGKFFR